MGNHTLEFKNRALESNLRPTCERVLKQFPQSTLRLLCLFDDRNPVQFDELLGPSHRGFHVPVLGSGTFWPEYVQCLFTNSYGFFICDNVIYVNARTSASSAGSTITLAHELQHFTQCGHARKVWIANTLIHRILREGPETPIKPWEIPSEREAIVVSKRVAEDVLGESAVSEHVRLQIETGDAPEDWKFFRDLSQRYPLDLLAETKPWVEEYRPMLVKIKQGEVDFAQNEWWK